MNKDYPVSLSTLSASERGEYQRGIKLLSDGDSGGLELALNVLENSRPFHVPGQPEKTLSWAAEIIEAYRNLGRVVRNATLPISKRKEFSELMDKIRGYDIVLEEDDKFPFQPLFDTLDRYGEINKILIEYKIEDPEKLKEVLNTTPDLERLEEEVEGFEAKF